MRISSSLSFSVLLCAAVATAGCSGAGGSVAAPTAGTGSQSLARNVSAELSAANPTGARVPFIAGQASRRAALRGQAAAKDAYVSDAGTNAVEILANQGWTELGQVTNGLDGNDGDWVDGKGNLYVANYRGFNVTEYAPNASSPTFTYSTGLEDPINVSVDGRGNVYVADFGYGRAGVLNVYAQGSNVVKTWCPVPGNVGGAEGVAIDSKGNVFLAFNQSGTGPGQIAEYAGGLKGCNPTVLPLLFTYIGGIAFDPNDNLIVCDQGSQSAFGSVDVIAPPYGSVTGKFGSGWVSPFHLAFRRKDSVVLIADAARGVVEVMKYPSGHVVTTLGRSNGIVQAIGVADAPEAAI